MGHFSNLLPQTINTYKLISTMLYQTGVADYTTRSGYSTTTRGVMTYTIKSSGETNNIV
jgi:hypothetical protein